MKEVVVAKPEECPFRQDDHLAYDTYQCSLPQCCQCDDYEKFPLDCPLFENDYLIKRRCGEVSQD